MTDREIVEAAWMLPTMTRCGTKAEPFQLVISSGFGTAPHYFRGAMEDLAWFAAARFTEDRLEKIRQLEAEMVEQQKSFSLLADATSTGIEGGWVVYAPSYVVRLARVARTLARLEAALADLKRGMKGESRG